MSTLVERHQHILGALKKKGSVQVVDLCQELNVSSVTIRKDLQFLEDKNQLFRTHGGATLTNPYIGDRSVIEKVGIKSAEKEKIGQYGASLIEPNDSILIASGTTVFYLAKNIQPKGNVTVLTSALNVAIEIAHHPGIEVIQLGGIMRKTSSSVTGVYAEKILEDFSCSKLFLGVDGIDLEFGLTTSNIQEAQLNRKMIAAARKTIILADSSKFGKRAFGKICDLDGIEQIITDSGVSPHIVTELEAKGLEVTVLSV
ncbi:DeoR/GlpR family DNA-binding transcription regulator [Niabella ginsenosidivorans]|nr:DeoR/GlpR family DNA-binding transcription regulator [Niabella ginsenosidivorans]